MGNKFIILTPAYKVAKWVELYVNMLKYQSHTNFEVYFIDDASPDNTIEIVNKVVNGDPRFHVYRNDVNVGSPLANIVKAFDYANPADEDIIVNVDGDDWLASVFVLQYLSGVYNYHNCWLTHGNYQMYPSGDLGGHAQLTIPDNISRLNAYKKFAFVTSHLRSYKAGLFRKVDRKDLIDPRTGQIYKEASDLALMFPMLEMAGNEKCVKINDILLILNRENEMNEAKINLDKQKETEHIIRTKQKIYDRIHNL
jgi:glycosyltransferase involved in cell wall biosynthesis